MEPYNQAEHRIIIRNREDVDISGIRKVISLEPELVVLETLQDRLTLRGIELHAKRVDMEKGEVQLTGNLLGMNYVNKKHKKMLKKYDIKGKM